MSKTARPKIYHIVHMDNFASIARDGHLWPGSRVVQRRGRAAMGNHEM